MAAGGGGEYELCFTQSASFDQPLVVGDAIRWVGSGLWQVEAVSGTRVTVRPWPAAEPLPDRVRGFGPDPWPHDP
jgi:hypothetical protein